MKTKLVSILIILTSLISCSKIDDKVKSEKLTFGESNLIALADQQRLAAPKYSIWEKVLMKISFYATNESPIDNSGNLHIDYLAVGGFLFAWGILVVAIIAIFMAEKIEIWLED